MESKIIATRADLRKRLAEGYALTGLTLPPRSVVPGDVRPYAVFATPNNAASAGVALATLVEWASDHEWAAALKRLRTSMGLQYSIVDPKGIVDRAIERMSASHAGAGEKEAYNQLWRVAKHMGLPDWQTNTFVGDAIIKALERREKLVERAATAEKERDRLLERQSNVRRRLNNAAAVLGVSNPDRYSASGALTYAMEQRATELKAAAEGPRTLLGVDPASPERKPIMVVVKRQTGATPEFDLVAEGLPVEVAGMHLRLTASQMPLDRVTARAQVMVEGVEGAGGWTAGTKKVAVVVKLPLTTGIEIIRRSWTVQGAPSGVLGSHAVHDIAAPYRSMKGKERAGITYIVELFNERSVPLS